MKLLISAIEDGYVQDKKVPEASVWDLTNTNVVMTLVLGFANGIFIEMRADGDSAEALEVLRGIAVGTANCKLAEMITSEIIEAWLYKEGYDCYMRPTEPPVYIFINPHPDFSLFQ